MTDTGELARRVEHRPWPLPREPWIMFQSWRDLLFAHWPLPESALRPHVPRELALDSFEGRAWVGLTPFRIEDLRPRFVPPLPVVSDFPELNLRTYVRVGDRPGVFFFSLDAGSVPAVLGARILYRLPYHPARMRVASRDGWIHYRCRRRGGGARFSGRYRPAGEPSAPRPGTLPHFLTERYALYAVPAKGRVLRAEIHHPPWSLRPAEAEIETNTIAAARGIELPDREPLLHFAGRQDTLVWCPRRVRDARRSRTGCLTPRRRPGGCRCRAGPPRSGRGWRS